MREFYHKFLMFFGFSKAPIMGLQVGATVKLLQLRMLGHKIKIEGYAIEPLLTSDPQGVLNAIKSALATSKLKATRVCTALSYSKVITKIVKFPTKLKLKDIAAEVEIELDKSIPYPVDAISFDYIILPATIGADEIEVLLAAATQQDITNNINISSTANLVTLGIDIDAYAIVRAFKFLLLRNSVSQKNYVLFNIEVNFVIIIIIVNDRILYVNEQVVSDSEDLTSVMLQLYYNFTASTARIAIDAGYLFGSPLSILWTLKSALEQAIAVPIIIADLSDAIELAPHICANTFSYDALALMQCYGLALGHENCVL